jgi:hypothetical protein
MEFRVSKGLNFGRQTCNQIMKLTMKALKNIKVEISEGDRFAR